MPDRAGCETTKLDTIRLRAELYFIHRGLNQVVATSCKGLLDELHGESASESALIWRALYADCLRVVYCAANADGTMYDFELERIRDLVTMAARHYTGADESPYGRQLPVDAASTQKFLERYVRDNGPFGYGAAVRWRGLELCRRAATVSVRDPIFRYARLMWWLIDEACRIGGVSPANPQWNAQLSEINDVRRELSAAGFGPELAVDRRVQTFLSGTHVFTPVEDARLVREPDPLDVEMLHAEARTTFRRLLDHARKPPREMSTGRTLLLVGSSGVGKTHLLRSFRSEVHEYGKGFVAYAQLYENVQDYTQHFLQQLVESLKVSYSGPKGGRTGLHELALGMARLRGPEFVARVERLAEYRGSSRSALDRQVNLLADELLEHAELARCGPDLIRVLLYSLCLDPRTTPRVHQYLCCEPMTEHDQSLIGGLAPRATGSDARAMLRNLAHVAFVTRGAALVLMADQIEQSGVSSELAVATFQRAVDCLLGIASEVHSVVVVIACLGNLRDKAIKVMGQSALDRLEKDPPRIELTSNLSYEEIEALVSHRLAWMFAENGVDYRAGEPVHPIRDTWLCKFVHRRARDILDQCQRFHQRCVDAGKIVDSEIDSAAPPALPPPSPPPPPPIAEAWVGTCQVARTPSSLDDEELLALVTDAAKAYAAEVGASLAQSTTKNGLLQLEFSVDVQRTSIVVGLATREPAAGAFGRQIRKLSGAANGAVKVAVRAEAFPSGAASKDLIEELAKSGGRAIVLDKLTIRALIAYRDFHPPFAPQDIEAWKCRDRPIASLARIAAMFGAEQPQPSATATDPGTSGAPRERRKRGDGAAPRRSGPQPHAG